VDLVVLARSTPGFVGADIENLVNEAAILAARRNLKVIGHEEFEEAIERVIAGPERKSRLISVEEKRIVAYHEAGHAVVAHALPEADPVHKVSIIARGMAGGYTLMLPEEDRTLMPKKKLLADMIGLLGGRAAEELVFDDITSGASNDLERVTRMARVMVTRLGMSEAMGPMVYGQKEELIFLGREISEQRDYSESVAEQIDQEVRSLVADSYDKARKILSQYRDKLDAVADRLLEAETVTREEFEEIFPAPVAKNGGTPVPQAA
jgi:cell division protease FtsH